MSFYLVVMQNILKKRHKKLRNKLINTQNLKKEKLCLTSIYS